MNCLFKADVKKVKIPFLKNAPFKTIYFSHSLISDIAAEKTHSVVDYAVMISKNSFSKPLLYANYINPLHYKKQENKLIEKINENTYKIKSNEFDLKLVSMKKPLLEAGTGYVNLKSQGSYYYSLTNLKTSGVLKINGKEIKVKGKSWMDHQWADTEFSFKTKWTWFSIQLSNSIELVCFEFDDGKNKTFLASISYENNEQESAEDVILTQLKPAWESSETKAKYPLHWNIKIPSKKIDLTTEPLLKEQEMLFGTINYWEGPLKITGIISNEKVEGNGFLELVGYPKGISDLTQYKNKIEKTISETIFPEIKKQGNKIINELKNKNNFFK
ncbi:MAG: hypothetical protein JW703_04960 [Candidatus Diapherotrites archaeon]|nr:hypothetical protein [Candidatus Diapherotrites archaeon]